MALDKTQDARVIDQLMRDKHGQDIEDDEDEVDELDQLHQDQQDQEDQGDLPDQEYSNPDSTLIHVSDALSLNVFLIVIVELCERFSYYSLSSPFQNYIQLPSGLNKGQSTATALSSFFTFWCYLTPILGAIIADNYLGRYNTICLFCIIYMIGLITLVVSSIPSSIQNGTAFVGLGISMLIIGLGAGGIKSNVAPLVAEQYTITEPFVSFQKNGRKVLVHPDVTIQRIFMIFYLAINIGSLGMVASVLLEHNVSFTAAFSLPLAVFVIGVLVLVIGRNVYIKYPPMGSALADAMKIIFISARHGYKRAEARYSTQFIEEVKKALRACRIFAAFPFFWLIYNQMMTNLVSQGGQMKRDNIPNDLLQMLNPICIITFIPIFDRFLYPFLRTKGYTFGPIARIAIGFLFAGLGMFYSSIIQHMIYTSGPCYTRPNQCSESGAIDGIGGSPNNIHIFWQVPAYIMIAFSEIFTSVTGLEYAYLQAGTSMKSVVMSIFLFMASLGSIISILLAPLSKDPNLGVLYFVLGCVAFTVGGSFWLYFGREGKLQSHKYQSIEMT